MKAISSLLSASALALLSTQGARAYSEGFDLTDHTSQLNFYHQAATDLTAEQVVLDDSCVVDQVHLVRSSYLKTAEYCWLLTHCVVSLQLMRHGTRYPSSGSYSAIKSFAETVTEYLS